MANNYLKKKSASEIRVADIVRPNKDIQADKIVQASGVVQSSEKNRTAEQPVPSERLEPAEQPISAGRIKPSRRPLTKIIAVLSFVILAVAGIYFVVSGKFIKFAGEQTPIPAGVINSFEECVGAGYPIMESYPERCATPDGRIFAKKISEGGGKENLIRVENPAVNGFVSSPLVVKGQARGNWYFEATFPVELLDAEGKTIVSHYAQAQGDWMTTDFVPFEAILNFKTPETQTGTLVLRKSNVADLPEYDDELIIPVSFVKTRKINLYYYNLELDRDEEGNILCSRKGLVAVEREIPLTSSPVKDAINLLLKGELTSEEEARNIVTEFPLEGLALKNAVLKDGVLTLTFDDPYNKTSGGSCRVGILWFQIEATAKQFPEVKEVKFLPEELFQP